MMEWICDEDPATVVVGAVAAILLLPDVGLADDAHGVPRRRVAICHRHSLRLKQMGDFSFIVKK